MDRFKFRAFNGKTMVYDNEDKSAAYQDGWVASDVEIVNQTLSNKYSDYAWMQCTGLKDKNGKLIFENDILKDSNSIGVVKFGEYEVDDVDDCGTQDILGWYLDAKVDLNYNPDSTFDRKYSLTKDLSDFYKIIGNIHENPELLESKNV